MYSMYASWFNEMEKLWVRRRTKGFLLLTVLISAIFAFLLAILQNKTILSAGLGSDFPTLMLGLFTTIFLPLFVFMAAADMFPGEVASRTLKLILIRPIVRSKVFASKVAALAVYIAVHLCAIWFVSVIAGMFLSNDNIWSSLLESIKMYTAAFVPMLAFGLIAIFIAVGFNNSTSALGLNLFIYIAAKLLPLVFPTIAVWSIFSYTDWYTLWAGGGVSLGKLFNTFALLLSYSILAYTAAWVIFDRKRL
jgi:ABC-2 type transport system permease protein